MNWKGKLRGFDAGSKTAGKTQYHEAEYDRFHDRENDCERDYRGNPSRDNHRRKRCGGGSGNRG